MSEWDSLISVAGTLSGIIIGLVAGYLTSSRIEAKKERHEEKMYYRNKLNESMENIIKPLYQLIDNLWASLVILEHFSSSKDSATKGKTFEDKVTYASDNFKSLKVFFLLNYSQIGLLFPFPISTWVFVQIESTIEKIFSEISQGRSPSKEFREAINALMTYKENLKKLIGYETDVELKEIYPLDWK